MDADSSDHVVAAVLYVLSDASSDSGRPRKPFTRQKVNVSAPRSTALSGQPLQLHQTAPIQHAI